MSHIQYVFSNIENAIFPYVLYYIMWVNGCGFSSNKSEDISEIISINIIL